MVDSAECLALTLTEPQRLEVLPAEAQGPLDEGQLLVRMEYAGVQPLDTSIFNGETGLECPRVLGNEGVGIIEHSECPAYDVGTRIAFVLSKHREDSGAWQTMVQISKERACIAVVPVDFAPQTAAAGITSSVLALACLRHFTKGSLLVIPGACGAAGNALLQLASLRGMQVVALVRGTERVARLAREFGASGSVVAVDVTAPHWVELALAQCQGEDRDGADGVIDGVGGDALIQIAENLIRVHGRIVTYGAAAGTADEAQLSAAMDRRSLRRIAEKVDSILSRRDASAHLQDAFAQISAGKYEPRVWQEVFWHDADKCLVPQPAWSEWHGASQLSEGRFGRILLRFGRP